MPGQPAHGAKPTDPPTRAALAKVLRLPRCRCELRLPRCRVDAAVWLTNAATLKGRQDFLREPLHHRLHRSRQMANVVVAHQIVW